MGENSCIGQACMRTRSSGYLSELWMNFCRLASALGLEPYFPLPYHMLPAVGAIEHIHVTVQPDLWAERLGGMLPGPGWLQMTCLYKEVTVSDRTTFH